MIKFITKRSFIHRLYSSKSVKSLEVVPNNSNIKSSRDELYQVLTSPVVAPLQNGPSDKMDSKLNPVYLEQLHSQLKASLTNDQQNPHNQTKHQESSSKDLPMELSDNETSLHKISHVIHLNSIAKRAKEAQEAFDLLEKNQIQPDLISYNHLLHAYANTGDIEKAEKIMQEIKDKGLKPDIVTYSTMIEALVKNHKLKYAFSMYEQLKKLGITPNRILYTSLIKGCLTENEIERAWKTFDHMRTYVCEPDYMTYTLMISICAKTKDAERALDLFHEMATRGHTASKYTFSSLIYACSSRPDYYLEAFNILEQMMNQGFQLDLNVYHALLTATARYGDYKRGRDVWNDMIEKSITDSLCKPTFKSFQIMFFLYEKSIRQWMKSQSLSCASNSLDSDEKASQQSQTNPYTTKTTSVVNSNHPLILKTPSDQVTMETLYQEANHLWTFFKDSTKYSDIMIPFGLTSSHLDSYLRVLCNKQDSLESALEYFDSEYSSRALDHTPTSFLTLIQKITMNQGSMKAHGAGIWDRFMGLDAKLEGMYETLPSPLTEAEKESDRALNGRDHARMFSAFMNMCRGYTLIGDTKAAVEMIEKTHSFRYIGYLKLVTFPDVWSLVTKAQEEAEDGKLELAKKLTAICHKTQNDLPSLVSHILKLKHIGSNWWGWKSINLSPTDRIKLMKRIKSAKKRKESALQRAQQKTFKK